MMDVLASLLKVNNFWAILMIFVDVLAKLMRHRLSTHMHGSHEVFYCVLKGHIIVATECTH